MEIIKSGVTRNVVLIGRYAVKIAKHQYKHEHFLQGCVANYCERRVTKIFYSYDCPERYMIAPTVWCSLFGLVSIQLRASLLNRELTDAEIVKFKGICNDIKNDNFGVLNERVVCIDYP